MAMMLSNIKVAPDNQFGVLKPDADGYYRTAVGALNYPNAHGHFYVSDGFNELISPKGSIGRRLRQGNVFVEDGHPKWPQGLSLEAYKHKLLMDDPDRTCGHMRSVSVLRDLPKNVRDNPNVRPDTMLIMADIKPHGTRANVLKESFESKFINTTFSIRAFSKDHMQGGTRVKRIIEILKWDLEHDPGIDIASKSSSPDIAMEARTWSLEDIRAIKHAIDQDVDSGIALESKKMELAELMYVFEREEKVKQEVISDYKRRKTLDGW